MARAYWKLPTRRWLLATRASTAPGSSGLAAHRPPGRHHGQRAGGRDAEGVHRLADDVLAQHRADRGQAVAAARERRAPGALEVQVAEAAVGVDELAEQQRAAVAEPRGRSRRTGARRRPAPPGVAPSGTAVPTSSRTPVGAAQPGGVEAELGGQRLVEHEQPRVGGLLGLPGDGQLRQLAGEAVAEGDGRMPVRRSRSRGYGRRRAGRSGREPDAGEPFSRVSASPGDMGQVLAELAGMHPWWPLVEPSPRWVRVRLGDELIADSRRALLHVQYGPSELPRSFLPTYYVPRDDVTPGVLVDEEDDGARAHDLVGAGRRAAGRAGRLDAPAILRSPSPRSRA